MLICHPAPPPLRRRRPNPTTRLDPSRTLSESSTSRTSNRHSSAPHRSVLRRMYAARAFSRLILNSYTEAWHVVTTVDAFLDSDEEDIDEPARHAYGASSRHRPSMSADPSIPDFSIFQPCVSRYLPIFIKLSPPIAPVNGNEQVPPNILVSCPTS